MPESRRPWWKKKRWAAAITLWVLLFPPLYVLSAYPAGYLYGKGWVDRGTARAVYTPLIALEGTATGDLAKRLFDRGFLASAP